jgi:tRNA_anti-like
MAIKKNLRNAFIAVVLIGLVVGAWAIWYVFYKPHRDVASEKPAYTMTSEALSAAFKSDATAITTYADKAILVSGPVTGIEGTHISLGNVVCNLDSTEVGKISGISQGQNINIQGRFTTYNDLMEEVMLDKCVIK